MSIDIKRVRNDVNGNSRYVIWWARFLHPESSRSLENYNSILRAARKAGGRMYSGKDFGGGIVFTTQEWEIPRLIERVRALL